MTANDTTSGAENHRRTNRIHRRRFIGVGAAAGTALLAGCTSGGLPTGSDDDPEPEDSTGHTDDEGETGRFRLLVSDQPVAIDDFDSLNVTLDTARIFGDTEDAPPDPTPTPSETPTPGTEPTPTPADEHTPTPEEGDGSDDETDTQATDEERGEEEGYVVLDLEGATVDLTEVIGDKAIEVFDGELAAGRYTKIELYPSTVEGIVDGNAVTVHVPSNRLRIVKPFEVSAGETVRFVFDINVVRRGNQDEYNLTPVIGESGVVGEDVEVEEVDPGDDGDSDGDGDRDSGGDGEDGTPTEHDDE